MVPLRGRLHRFAMETCSARVGPHTVFALAPCASWLKNALGTKRVSHCGSRRSFFWAGLDLDKEKLKGALRFTAWYGGLQTLVLMLAFLLPLNVWQKLPLSSSAWHRL